MNKVIINKKLSFTFFTDSDEILYINVLGSIDSSNSYDFQVRLNLFIKDKTKLKTVKT